MHNKRPAFRDKTNAGGMARFSDDASSDARSERKSGDGDDAFSWRSASRPTWATQSERYFREKRDRRYKNYEIEDAHANDDWYGVEEAPLAKFDVLRRVARTERVRSVVDDVEAELAKATHENDALRAKIADHARAIDAERQKTAKLKTLCKERVLKERAIFGERIAALVEKLRKYKNYIENRALKAPRAFL